MIASELDDWKRARGGETGHHEHRYRGGVPSRRLYRLQLSNEVRARAAGVPWDFIDPRVIHAKTQGLCGRCRRPVGLQTMRIWHLVPMSKGGPHLLPNLVPIHHRCPRGNDHG